MLKYMTGKIPRVSRVEVCKLSRRMVSRMQVEKEVIINLKTLDNEVRIVIVPLHGEIAPKTLNSILKQDMKKIFRTSN